jgi:hypothetical protein
MSKVPNSYNTLNSINKFYKDVAHPCVYDKENRNKGYRQSSPKELHQTSMTDSLTAD